MTQATSADFNGDGLADLAIAHGYARTVSIYLNQGNLHFMRRSQPVSLQPNDVAARDVNGDGRQDLVIAAADQVGSNYYNDGFAQVFLGAGDGTFTAAGSYPTGIGPISIVFWETSLVTGSSTSPRPTVRTGSSIRSAFTSTASTA